MSRRATAGFDDDDLDYDDYDENEEEELSPEDKAAMTSGTAEIRKALGSDATKLTVNQIQDALWHYYYDVEKSVAYLRKTFLTPAPKPTVKKPSEGYVGDFVYPWPHAGRSKLDYDLFFEDMPWLNVPGDRQTVFIKPPALPGGLLGGGGDSAPKMSKLQALAAERKKKTDQKKQEQGKALLAHTEKEIGKLSIDGVAQRGSQRSHEGSPKRCKLSSKPDSQSSKPNIDEEYEKKEELVSSGSSTGEAKPTGNNSESHPVNLTTGKIAPSAFAQTLFGPAPGSSGTRTRNYFAMPYESSPDFSAGAFAQPSPDDVVLAAQAKAGKKASPALNTTKKGTKGANTAKAAQATNAISNLKISDGPPPKSKGLDVIQEFEKGASKRSVSFVVVGHVDAGKSTLMGRLLLELKFVDPRTVDKYRKLAEKSGKQSFALAWVMDQRSEERERGVTIDIATNHFETDRTKFTILDAPGHKDFVPNMIAGASQADFAILVLDANTGAFERGLKGQTREHVLLLRSLGVQRLIVAVNKLDMVGWSQERFSEISQQVTGFLAGLGFQDKHVIFVPISGLKGENIAKPIEDSTAAWFTGLTLVEALETSGETTARELKKPFRLAISEIFRSQLGTTTLSGRIDSGTIQVGDAVAVQPSGETGYIKSIMVDQETNDWAVAGQNVNVVLANIDPIHFRVGDILCDTRHPIECGDTFTMRAMAFEHMMPMPVDLHRGRLHAAGQISQITATLDKATGLVVKKKPKVIAPGAVARIVIKLGAKVPMEAGQRVVIRSNGETVAAGLLE